MAEWRALSFECTCEAGAITGYRLIAYRPEPPFEQRTFDLDPASAKAEFLRRFARVREDHPTLSDAEISMRALDGWATQLARSAS